MISLLTKPELIKAVKGNASLQKLLVFSKEFRQTAAM
jgi:hypothetical protein